MSVPSVSLVSSENQLYSLDQGLREQAPLNVQKLTSNSRFQLSRGSYLTGIQTLRCISVIGFVGSLIASVLVPAIVFGSILLTACVLKNRVEQKDSKALEFKDQKVEETAKSVLSRSSSTTSRVSTSSKLSSNSSIPYFRHTSMEKLGSSPSRSNLGAIQEEKGVEETFFSYINGQSFSEMESQCFDLLTLNYFALLSAVQNKAPIPKFLGNNKLFKTTAINYLQEKVKKCEKESNALSVTHNNHCYTLTDLQEGQLAEQKDILARLLPSQIFDLNAKIYDRIADQKKKLGEAADDIKRFERKADHAREYAELCRKEENMSQLHFTEDAKQAV